MFQYDPYESLTRCLDREAALVFVDVGANDGTTAARMLEVFPRAVVHAFEPGPGAFKKLQARAEREARIKVYNLACGPSDGEAVLNVTRNDWCSSVLAPSELGQRYYGEWYQTEERVRVEMVSLDAWMSRAGVGHVDVVKIDAQGYDLEVLRGAGGMLAKARAVSCECQFAPEYEGCATFSQVDRHLAERGFALHQIHELWAKGREEQTSYADALWLKAEVLERLRSRTDLPGITPAQRVRRALEIAQRDGHHRAALFGAGRHTEQAASGFDELPLPLVAVIDDDPKRIGTTIAGRPVIGRDDVGAMGIDVVVLSSDLHEAALWGRTLSLREAGVAVMPLYAVHETPKNTPAPKRAATGATR